MSLLAFTIVDDLPVGLDRAQVPCWYRPVGCAYLARGEFAMGPKHARFAIPAERIVALCAPHEAVTAQMRSLRLVRLYYEPVADGGYLR